MKNHLLRYVSLVLFAGFLFLSQPMAQQPTPSPVIIRMENTSAEEDFLLYRFPTWTNCTPALKKDVTLVGDMEGKDSYLQPEQAPADAAPPPDASPQRYNRWGRKIVHSDHLQELNVAQGEGLHELRLRTALGVFIDDSDGQVVVTGKLRRWRPQPLEVQPGDVLIAIDDQPVKSGDDIQKAIEQRLPGEWVHLTVEREGSGRLEINHRLTSMKYVVPASSTLCELFIGVTTEPQEPNEGQGIQVLKVHAGTSAEKIGVQRGDRILAMDGYPITHADALKILRDRHQPGDEFRLTLLRNGEVLELLGRFNECDDEAGPSETIAIETEDLTVKMGPDASVFPNPVTDLLGIEISGPATVGELAVFDEMGRQVYFEKLDDVPRQMTRYISLQGAPTGMLIVNVKLDDQVLSRQVLRVNGQ